MWQRPARYCHYRLVVKTLSQWMWVFDSLVNQLWLVVITVQSYLKNAKMIPLLQLANHGKCLTVSLGRWSRNICMIPDESLSAVGLRVWPIFPMFYDCPNLPAISVQISCDYSWRRIKIVFLLCFNCGFNALAAANCCLEYHSKPIRDTPSQAFLTCGGKIKQLQYLTCLIFVLMFQVTDRWSFLYISRFWVNFKNSVTLSSPSQKKPSNFKWLERKLLVSEKNFKISILLLHIHPIHLFASRRNTYFWAECDFNDDSIVLLLMS